MNNATGKKDKKYLLQPDDYPARRSRSPVMRQRLKKTSSVSCVFFMRGMQKRAIPKSRLAPTS